MSRVNSGSRFGGERIKLALIPVLGLILVAIAFWAARTRRRAGPRRRPAPSPQRIPSAALNQTAAGPQPDLAGTGWEISWPTIPPFEPRGAPVPPEMPAASPAAAGNPNPAPAEPPAQTPGQLQAIYHDARGDAAILDSQIRARGRRAAGWQPHRRHHLARHRTGTAMTGSPEPRVSKPPTQGRW